MRHIFMNNYHLCSEISDRVVHHFVHCIETHGRRVQYLRFLQTIVKADCKYVKKCQDKVMTEVSWRGERLCGRVRNARMVFCMLLPYVTLCYQCFQLLSHKYSQDKCLIVPGN